MCIEHLREFHFLKEPIACSVKVILQPERHALHPDVARSRWRDINWNRQRRRVDQVGPTCPDFGCISDHLLDVVATPAAVVAGMIMTASVVTGLDPMLKWTLALIAGGGIAGTVQALTVGTRKVSLLTTGGLGNPVVSTVELLGSVLLTVLAIALPLLAFAVIAWALFFGVRHLLRLLRGAGRAAA